MTNEEKIRDAITLLGTTFCSIRGDEVDRIVRVVVEMLIEILDGEDTFHERLKEDLSKIK